MAQYDGSIRINTEINTSNVSSQMMRIVESTRHLETQAERLRARLQELATTQIPTQEYRTIESDISRANRELDRLLERQAQMQNEGRNSGTAWETLNQRIQASRDYIEQAQIELQELVDAGRAFTLGRDTEEFQRVSEQLRHTEAEIDINNRRLEEMRERQDRIPGGFENMRTSARAATQSIDEQLGRVTRKVNSLLRMLGTSLGLSLGIVGLAKLGKEAVETASNVLEVQNVVDVAFGKMSYKIENFAKNSIKNFGLSQLSAKQMGSTFMAMGTSMVDSMEDASNMAVTLVGRAADMASFFNVKVSEASTALQSIYTGETKTLKRYGVVMTEVNLQEYAYQKGINKKISAMTQQEKVMLRYNYVLEKTSLAEGDFVRTQDNWANQTRILSEQFKELLSILGAGLITVLNPIVKFLNTVLSMLIAIARQIGEILSKLFGISIPVADSGKLAEDLTEAAGGADDLTEGIEAAGKAAKGALAPFDKLNVLSQESGGSGASGGVGGGFEIPELEMEETVSEADAMSSAIDDLLGRLKPLFDWFTKLKNLFVEGFFDGLGESWKARVDEITADARNIVKTLAEIFTDPSVVSAAQTTIEKIVYSLGQVLGSITSIGITIAQNLIGGIDIYLEENKEFLKQKLVSIFDIAGDIALLIGEAMDTIAYIFEAFGSENGQQLTANLIGIFNDTLLNLIEIAGKFGRGILDAIITPISDNKEGLRAALEGLLGVAAEVAGTVKDAIDDTFAKINEVYDKYFKPFFESIKTGLSELIAKFLEVWNGYIQPILDDWAIKFDELWKDHIQPMINNIIEHIGLMAEIWTDLWNGLIKPFIDYLMGVFVPQIADVCDIIFGIVSAVISTIADAISGIIEVINGVINILLGIAKGDWQRVWDGFSDVVDGVVTVIKGIINNVVAIFEGLANAVVAAINTVIRAINSVEFTIPDWVPSVGGQSIGFNLNEIDKVSIPRLADGAVIRGGDPFMAVLGDQRHGQTNIETPLPTMVKAFKQAIAESGGMGGGEWHSHLHLGEKEIYGDVVKQDQIRFRRTGKSGFSY